MRRADRDELWAEIHGLLGVAQPAANGGMRASDPVREKAGKGPNSNWKPDDARHTCSELCNFQGVAVDQLQQILDSPEVARLVKTIEYVRWTGRPGYPVRAMVGMCLVKRLYALSTRTWVVRQVAEDDGLQRVLGCPPLWACSRSARQLRDRDGWTLDQCIEDVIAGRKTEHP